MDDFELEYADELEALEEFEGPDDNNPPSRRSLHFTTPKNKSLPCNQTSPGDDLNNSRLTPLVESPYNEVNGSVLHNAKTGSGNVNDQTKTPTGKVTSEKRARDDFNVEQDEHLPDLIPRSKRARLSSDLPYPPDVTNIVITPPPSPDAAISARIREGRSSVRTRHAESIDELLDGPDGGYDLERQRVFSRVPSSSFIGVTSSEGTRVYMQMRDEDDLQKEFDTLARPSVNGNLLTVPYHELRDQVEDKKQRQLLEESEKITVEINRQLDEDLGLVDADIEVTVPLIPELEPQHCLWVEKYAPHRYTELLSDEFINRTLLHWIKLWDFVVFGKEVKIKKKDQKKGKPEFKKKFQPEVVDELDKLNRPLQKVVLLSGPPGLGKTTLAHIIAKHAGYNVVEINASDDRSAELFKNKLEAATQMKAVMGADPRPNCLIIDEIDGAPQPAINILLNLVRQVEHPKGKKKTDQQLLLRPIICICNDQYTPALRQLRQIALIMIFPPTEPMRLASRLYEVTRMENLKAHQNTLLALCDKTDNDIRSCLNTLQFMHRQQKELTLRSVQTMDVGQKDTHKTLFSVWHEIFTMPRLKRNRFVDLSMITDSSTKWTNNNTTPSARFQNILSLTQATGEYEKIMQGIYENYLEANSKDPKLQGLTLSNEWFCFVDVINQYTARSQDYSLMKYVPFVAVICHLLFASMTHPKVHFPQAQYEFVTKKTKMMNLITSMTNDMLPSVRTYVNLATVTLEILPPLMDIMQPTLRPVNTQLYSSREKEELAQLVRIMIAYNVTYHQEKSPEGQYNYVLDPNMDEVAHFSGMKQHRQLTYAAKQLIAREIELEKMRRNEAAFGSTAKYVPPVSKAAGPVLPNHKQRLEAKTVVKQDVPVLDFFGRAVKQKTPDPKKVKEKKKTDILTTDIWFHFKEGYSNAVRRNVKMQDLL